MDNISTMLQLCRLCLVKDNVNIPIFEEQGDISQIFQKISSCLPVKVSREDKLPQKICDGCSYKLDVVYDFRNTTVNAEKQLLTWLSESQGTVLAARQAEPEVVQHIKPSETFVKQEAIDPSDLSKEEDDVKSYMFHDKFEEQLPPENKAVENDDDEPPPKRAKRTAAVKAAIAIDDHESDEDDDDSGEPLTKVEDESDEGSEEDHTFVDIPSTSADDQPGPSGVGKDGGEAPSKSVKPKKENVVKNSKTKKKKDHSDDNDPDFINEEKKPVKKRKIKMEIDFDLTTFVNLNEPTLPLICLHCSEEFKTHLDFGLHSRTHNERKCYSCHLCEFQIESKTLFRNHLRGHDSYKCEKCQRILKNKLSAYKHSKTHLTPNIVQCEICGKYLKKQCLYMHRRNLHSEASQTYKCPICNKEYVHSSSLRQHYSSFHKELGIDLSVVCDICGMKLSCKAKLDQHHRTHTGEKPFACTICQKRCISRDVLLSHMRVHTGEKPFLCKYCGKRFAHSAPYRYHIKTHTGEKSHMCPICGRGFISKANMRIHLKTCNQPHQ